MSWVSIAILSVTVGAIVNIIDSRLLSRQMPSLRSYLLLFAIIHFTYSWVFFFLFPLPKNLETESLLIAVASGLLRTAAITLLFYILQKEEVARVIPVFYTYPIFVAIMAEPLLEESLSYLQWLAIVVVVAGAIIISVRRGSSGFTIWLGKPFLLLFCSSLLMAMMNITSKYALAHISPWSLFWISTFCVSSVYLLISLRPHIFRQISNLKRRNSTLVLFVFNETLTALAAVLLFWALETGPASLVSAIVGGSRPVFVFIFALILSRIWPMFLEWQSGKVALTLRITATIMIVGGLTIIYLT